MADNAQYSDDILALWGPREDGALEPDRPRPPGVNGVAPMADGLALAVVRSEAEGAFTHQLAGVLHELLAASGNLSDRIAALQHDVSTLHEAVADLHRAAEAQPKTMWGRGGRTH